MSKFDIDVDKQFGVLIYTTQENLTIRCLSGSEIDKRVAQLKSELDAVAERAKKEIWNIRKGQDFQRDFR